MENKSLRGAWGEALAAELTDSYGTPVSASDVAITAGCNLAFTMAMTAIAGSGDAVLLPVPWYFNHRMTLELLGIEALPFATRAEGGFGDDDIAILAAALGGGATWLLG